MTLDDRGFAVRRSYQNHYGIPQHDANGSYGQSIAHSSDGLYLRIAAVGADGNEITLNIGARAINFTYGSNYLLTSWTLIGPDNKPINGRDGYADYTVSYDRWGNIATIEYHAADGSPALSKAGVAKNVRTYDERGNEIEDTSLGLDGRPTLNTNGVAIVAAAVRPTRQCGRVSLLRSRRQADRQQGRIRQSQIRLRRSRPPERPGVF